jgi:hypothetical protein
MAGKIRTDTIRWYIGAAVCMLVILVMAAGCSMASSPPPGKDGGGSGGGSGAYGPSSQSVGNGDETWQASISYTETDHISKAMKDTLDTSGSGKETESSTLEMHGTFPVTVHHSQDDSGINQYIIDGKYPVSGTYERDDHKETYGSMTDVTSNQDASFEIFDMEEQGAIADTHLFAEFDLPSKKMVQLDNSFDTTLQEKQVAQDKDYNYEKTSTGTGGVWTQCHSESGPSDDYSGGTHDFHMDGTRYVIVCHATTSRPYTDDTTGSYSNIHYDPSSAETKEMTLKVTLDPEYVQGQPTPVPTSTPEPTISLAPLKTTVSLAPLVSPTVSLAPLVTPGITLAPLVTP